MLAKFSVKKPVTITMMILIVIVIGAVSLSKLQIDLLPQMDLPYVMVQTTYQGAGPEEIENIISIPLEQTLSTFVNVPNTSNSSISKDIILFIFSSLVGYFTAKPLYNKSKIISSSLITSSLLWDFNLIY
jgi:HAE1 family hydrophobic/amphiphilic exporter-1